MPDGPIGGSALEAFFSTMRKMRLRPALAALLIVTNAWSVLAQSDPACTTPANKNGFCVALERCRNIYNLLNGGTPTRGHLNYIKRAACTLPNVERSICCQPEEVNHLVTTTTSTTTNAPSGTMLLLSTPPIKSAPLAADDTVVTWDMFQMEQCGLSTYDRIAGGNKTRPFEFPWMVVLRYQTSSGLEDKCGGSLINTRYVLTAAHCVRTSSSSRLVKVRLGEHDKTTDEDCITYQDGEVECAPPAYDVDIEEMIIPKDYNRPIKFRHDIALIRMAEEIKYSDSVKPICLPVDENVRKQLLPKYIITGWGTTEEQTVSPLLLQAFVHHVTIPECQQKMNDNFLAVTLAEPWQMCARGDNLTDSCQGDSGGPLAFTVSIAGSAKMVQYGVVSAGVRSCGKESVPGIYTSVPAYMKWIVANMRP